MAVGCRQDARKACRGRRYRAICGVSDCGDSARALFTKRGSLNLWKVDCGGDVADADVVTQRALPRKGSRNRRSDQIDKRQSHPLARSLAHPTAHSLAHSTAHIHAEGRWLEEREGDGTAYQREARTQEAARVRSG